MKKLKTGWIALLILYFLWSTYWYFQVGLVFIKWHTHIMFWVYLFLLFHGILTLFKARKKILYFNFLCFFGLLICEIFLMFTGLTKNFSEKDFGSYLVNRGSNTYQDYYWISKPGETKEFKSEEFEFTRKENSLGFSDPEWKMQKDSNEFRILCLGDSFTEGDGAHFDSSYVSALRRQLGGKKITIMNAGKCGSDPFFNFMNYKDRLLPFAPDLIIQTLSSHDLKDDIYARGGLERFKPNYKTEFRKANPAIETIYALSYTSRIFFKMVGYNELVFNSKTYYLNYRKDQKMVLDLFDQYTHLAQNNQAELMLVSIPNGFEYEQGYPGYFKELLGKLKQKNMLVCDLNQQYHQRLDPGKKDVEAYFWPKNRHFNARGYALMAQCIFEFIHQENLLKHPN